MAKFQLTLGDGDGAPSWLLDLGTMKISEAELCEQLTGWDAEQWREGLIESRARAIKFAVYLAQYRAGDNPEWKTLDFDIAALDWELLDDDGNPVPPPVLGVTEDDADTVPTGPPAGDQPGGE